MKRVLILEDDAIMAFDLADQLSMAGFQVVGPAITADEALKLLATEGCDVATLDVNLGGGRTSEPVAIELRRLAIPFVVVSGYASEQHSAVFREAPLVVKPVRFDRLLKALGG